VARATVAFTAVLIVAGGIDGPFPRGRHAADPSDLEQFSFNHS
jgi:hypothetical protein